MSRPRVLLSAALAAATLLGSSSATASTPVGQVPASPVTCVESPIRELLQESVAGGLDYVVPAAGVLTSWSHQAGPDAGIAGLRVYRPTTTPGTYTVVGDAGLETEQALSGLHTYPTRIAVRAGDRLGLRISGQAACLTTGAVGDVFAYQSAAPGPVGSDEPFTTGFFAARIDVSAVLEPDADGDGFGDETQDRCPDVAATQGPCTPETTITKKPKRSAHGRTSRLRFASSIAGSTFRCSLDGRRARACSSPTKYFCLSPGRHRFAVSAISPFATADPTPATARFRVGPHRQGC